MDLGFLICTREAVPKPSAGPSAHAVHYQDSRLESSQERPDSSALRRWDAGWAAPLGLICSSGRGLGTSVSHRQSFHRLTEVSSYRCGVTNLHALELSPGWRLQWILCDRGDQSVPLSPCSPSAATNLQPAARTLTKTCAHHTQRGPPGRRDWPGWPSDVTLCQGSHQKKNRSEGTNFPPWSSSWPVLSLPDFQLKD